MNEGNSYNLMRINGDRRIPRNFFSHQCMYAVIIIQSLNFLKIRTQTT